MTNGDESSFKLVIAIDFGTSRSGFAYAYKNDSRIFGHTDWPDQPIPYPKTLTHLIYPPEEKKVEPEGKKVEAWGYPARKKLAELRSKETAKDYIFLSQFKMKLHNPENRRQDKDGPSITVNGREFLLINVIADYLEELKDFALENIQGTKIKTLTEKEIQWCLTVPAIWDDVEKNYMRRAAQKAGLISQESDRQRLVLALEPEAAALYCQARSNISTKMLPGIRYMVADCGGGTLDIITYEVVKNGQIKGVSSPGGSKDGSMYVDREFLEYLKNKLGSQNIELFHNNHPIEYLTMMDEWERIKCNFRAEDEVTYFPLPIPLYKIMISNEKSAAILEDLANEQEGNDENIILESTTMESFFKPRLDNLISEMNKQFNQLDSQRCNFIFLVGGFSQSPVLQQRVRQEFQNKVERIVIPANCPAAIVEGAVLYGLDPKKSVIGRYSCKTYGCEVELPFDSDKHREAKKVPRKLWTESNCKDCFQTFVKAGEYIPADNQVEKIVTAEQFFQREISLNFYATLRKEVDYVDESHVEHLGTLKVDISDIWEDATDFWDFLQRGAQYLIETAFRPDDWKVKVIMYFGETEIRIEAIDSRTGKRLKAEFDLLSTYFQEEIKG